MSTQKRFSDLKDGDLFIILKAKEPARVMYFGGDRGMAYEMRGIRRWSMAVFGNLIRVAPQEPVKLIDKKSFIGDD